MNNAHSNAELVKVLAAITGIGILFIVVLHQLTALIP